MGKFKYLLASLEALCGLAMCLNGGLLLIQSSGSHQALALTVVGLYGFLGGCITLNVSVGMRGNGWLRAIFPFLDSWRGKAGWLFFWGTILIGEFFLMELMSGLIVFVAVIFLFLHWTPKVGPPGHVRVIASAEALLDGE